MSTKRFSNCLMIPAGALELMVRRALSSIDAVHSVSDVPDVPLYYTNDLSRFGAYVPEQDGTERYFELSYYGPHPGLTLIHEAGHFLDHALGGFDVYLSSETVSLFSKVKQALESSNAVRSMRDALASSAALPQTHRFQLSYWLNPQEQWARAYAQFIAVRSENPQLKQSIAQSRDARSGSVFRNVQWEEDDFAPIDAAVGTAFKELRWMK